MTGHAVPPLVAGSDMATALYRIWSGHKFASFVEADLQERIVAAASVAAHLLRSDTEVVLLARPDHMFETVADVLSELVGDEGVYLRDRTDARYDGWGPFVTVANDIGPTPLSTTVVALSDGAESTVRMLRKRYQCRIITVYARPDTGWARPICSPEFVLGDIPLDVALAGGL